MDKASANIARIRQGFHTFVSSGPSFVLTRGLFGIPGPALRLSRALLGKGLNWVTAPTGPFQEARGQMYAGFYVHGGVTLGYLGGNLV